VLDRKGIKQIWLAEQLGKSYNMVNSYVQNRQQPRLLGLVILFANVMWRNWDFQKSFSICDFP
jgi:hypothetical protein